MRQFYGHLEKCVLSAGKTMSIKFPFLGGFFFGGGGECRFYFYGRADFSEFLNVRFDTRMSDFETCLFRPSLDLVSSGRFG